jgi:hypothetical protein
LSKKEGLIKVNPSRHCGLPTAFVPSLVLSPLIFFNSVLDPLRGFFSGHRPVTNLLTEVPGEFDQPLKKSWHGYLL